MVDGDGDGELDSVDGADVLSGACDDGGELSVPGPELADSGVVLTPGAGVVGAPGVWRSVIRTAAPIANTTNAVPMITTAGRRYQGTVAAP
ncbi:hypothetical protein, partial [Mycobacterium kyorinense]|uniref:hypothetical protein n=1 Tax=Mycobacterium kyorinense TaxID=487514 RepID=UPI0012E7BAC6